MLPAEALSRLFKAYRRQPNEELFRGPPRKKDGERYAEAPDANVRSNLPEPPRNSAACTVKWMRFELPLLAYHCSHRSF
jgi:hypothetical protein